MRANGLGDGVESFDLIVLKIMCCVLTHHTKLRVSFAINWKN